MDGLLIDQEQKKWEANLQIHVLTFRLGRDTVSRGRTAEKGEELVVTCNSFLGILVQPLLVPFIVP